MQVVVQGFLRRCQSNGENKGGVGMALKAAKTADVIEVPKQEEKARRIAMEPDRVRVTNYPLGTLRTLSI